MSNFETSEPVKSSRFSFANLRKLAVQFPQAWGIPLAFIALFNLISKIFIINPAIVPDEYLYAKYSRLIPMAEAAIPDYLFYWVFGATKTCGPDFYTCGKAINILFFVGVAIFVFLIAKKLVPIWVAWLVSCLTLLSPIGYYASFFMPEMMLFFAALVVIYLMLQIQPHHTWGIYLGLGLVLGLASLTKPHALFIGAPIAVYAIYVGRSANPRAPWTRIALNVSSAAIGTVISKFAVGFLFAGPSGLSLFGSSYTGTLTSAGAGSPKTESSIQGSADLVAQIEPTNYFAIFFGQLGAHGLATVLMYFAALAMGYLAFSSLGREAVNLKRLFVVAISVLLTGVFTIAAFTAIVSGSGINHSDRIMVRYYDYLVPVAYVLLVASSYQLIGIKQKLKSYIAPIIALLLAIYALASQLAPFKPNFYDGTSLDGFLNWPWLGWAAIGLGVLSILVAISGSRIQFVLTTFILLPLLTIGSFSAAAQSLTPSSVVDRFDRAAEFAKSYLLESEFEQLTVVSYESYPLSRALLQIDNADVDFRLVEKGQILDVATLDENKDWVLLIGDSFINSKGCIRQQGNGYQLIKLCKYSSEYYFNQEITSDALVSSVQGIGDPENWGAWTIGSKAVINFREAIPANSKVDITMAASPFADEQEYIATLGDSSITFTLDSEAIDAGLEFQNSSASNQLIIEIPRPKSAKEAGQGRDARPVGIQLFKVSISK